MYVFNSKLILLINMVIFNFIYLLEVVVKVIFSECLDKDLIL